MDDVRASDLVFYFRERRSIREHVSDIDGVYNTVAFFYFRKNTTKSTRRFRPTYIFLPILVCFFYIIETGPE